MSMNLAQDEATSGPSRANTTPSTPGLPRSNTNTTLTQITRLRAASLTIGHRILEKNPQRGMWQATGTAIAHAPNLTDLRSRGDVEFDAHGHSNVRVHEADVRANNRRNTARTNTFMAQEDKAWDKHGNEAISTIPLTESPTQDEGESEDGTADAKVPWSTAFKKAGVAFGKFILTPGGLFITIYGLNVVAWGAMLFFLLLKVGSMSQERKDIWIEIDSQILNALFCLTAWGLAPWRFRDLYWVAVWRSGNGDKSKRAIAKLAERNTSWFRRRESDLSEDEGALARFAYRETFTGEVAPPTASWKMDFVVWCVVFNSLFQIGMASFMWCYNRHNRPSFGVGLFIGLGCFSSLLGGVMSWWEGRKIKLIEGPKIKIKEMA